MQVFRSDQRGVTRSDWLTSYHSFSFGNYYRDDRNGFSVLRAINDVEVAPESGFPTHSQRDMEIFSYVLSGELAHKDNAGNVVRLPAGEFQLMSAGSGIRHSEHNPLAARKLHFLQVWLVPDQEGMVPAYQQRYLKPSAGIQLVASEDGADNSLRLRQNARIFRVLLDVGQEANPAVDPGRRYYLHQIKGRMRIDLEGQSELVGVGDGAACEGIAWLRLRAMDEAVEALLLDLP
jgi:quercetin 2,3-dioxygenase